MSEQRRLEAHVLRLEQERAAGLPFRDVVEPCGVTLLHRAASVGRLDLVTRLVALGADPSGADCFAYTALDRLTQNGGVGQVRKVEDFLRSIGGRYIVFDSGVPAAPPRPGSSAAIRAARHAESVAKLTATIDAIEALRRRGEPWSETTSPCSASLLHTAAMLGELGLACRLIALGADPSGRDRSGRTALDLLERREAVANHDEMWNYLLAVGGTFAVGR